MVGGNIQSEYYLRHRNILCANFPFTDMDFCETLVVDANSFYYYMVSK